MLTKQISACRSCGSDRLNEVLDLGNLCVSDFVTDPAAEPDRAPLTLLYCVNCAMVQLAHTFDRDKLYKTTYWYRSSVNPVMVAALEDVVEETKTHVDLFDGDTVIDIGANDGTLLDFYPRSVQRVGVEPSSIGDDMLNKGHAWYPDYFPFWAPEAVERLHGAKIITSIAQLYNVEHLNEYVAQIKELLHPDGVWIAQFQDLASMLRCNGFDNVCHEHITYPSRQSMAHLLRRHGLGIDTWSEHAVNGGSLRLVVKHADKARNQSPVPETDQGWRSALRVFAARTEANRYDVRSHLEARKARGERVLGIAASTKFNTLAQYYGLGPDLVEAIGERSPEKVGRYTVGTNIPIISEEEMRARNPDALLCCAWQFADAFARRESALIAAGTRLIVPLPRLHVLGSEGLARAA